MSKVLEDIWECGSWLVIDDVQRLDRKLYGMMEDARIHGIKRDKIIEFFQRKLSETIEHVAENRETDKQQAKRQRESILSYQSGRLAGIGRPSAKTPQKQKKGGLIE